jgi:hypothetical protein
MYLKAGVYFLNTVWKRLQKAAVSLFSIFSKGKDGTLNMREVAAAAMAQAVV